MSQEREYTRAEVAAAGAGAEARTLFVIDNAVFDVQSFLDEHPGGHEVLVHARGGDATEAFDDIGHSSDAKELMLKYRVGAVAPAERRERPRRGQAWGAAPGDEGGWFAAVRTPLLVGALATALYVTGSACGLL